MDDENKNIPQDENENIEVVKNPETGSTITRMKNMFQNWFLDYASYVILERAVPHIYDGLKPVQRRILHAMKQIDDGRFNKVANIVGQTMQYHPHGDAAIGGALVQLGQKDLLIDTQGNWGNILTGDSAAAPRYIEARLSKFALEVAFNSKTTFWKDSYDGRKQEPINLPIKFPLLLAQGVEGIAVGLNSIILPHNFNELLDACIAELRDEPYQLFPDFPTGGLIDVSRYNDGLRGGKLLVRAKIEKVDKKTLAIREIPYGQTTSGIIETILKANEKGKIKIKKVDDNTAENAEIVIELQPGISADVTIDALYAFTSCQVSISPNACVIEEDKPRFATVTEILGASVRNTLELLRMELNIKKKELEEQWHYQSLEKWFIEKRIYKEKAYENAGSNEEAVDFIMSKVIAHKLKLLREVTNEDILKLLEIRMKRILRFNIDKANDDLNLILEQINEVQNNLDHIVDYTIKYYQHIKEKYGEGRERKTEIRNFDSIDAGEVAVANEKLYANFEEGFVGYGLKKDQYICDCSDIDDIIVIHDDGKYQISKVTDKAFFGKGIIYIGVYRKNDKRTIYNVVYRDGKSATSYIKRFAITNVIRDKEYDITKGTAGSKLLYFTANPNGEAEIISCKLKPKPKLRKLTFDVDFKDIAVKNRDAQGNIFARTEIHKVTLKEEGFSTLGGRKVWFDNDVLRLNSDGRGLYLGEFSGADKILVISNSGDCIFTNFDFANHYNDDITIIEKYHADRIFTAIHFDAEQKFFYLKRFNVQEMTKPQSLVSEYEGSYMVAVSEDKHPQVKITFGGKDENREPEIIDAEEFIGVKGITARGKRLTTYSVKEICFIEPLIKPEDEEPEPEEPEDEGPKLSDDGFMPDSGTQMSLF